jgi:excisionase family DNA binding protein
MNDAHAPQLLPIQEVARRMALSIRTVRTLVALRKLPVVRVGARAVRVAESDLAAFIEARRVAPR